MALTHPQYQAFIVALLLTSIAAQILLVATLWQVYVLTGSALLLGLTGLARAVPQIALSLVGGVVADRVDRVRMVQFAQAANAILILALAAVTLSGSVEVWHVYAVTFLNGALTALTGPARSALIPNLVPHQHLMNAIALNSTIIQLSHVLGPALGGAVISAVDLFPTYVINGAAYAVSFVAMTFLHVAAPVSPRERESPWQSLLAGLAFVRERSVILSMLGMDVASQLFGGYRALLPIFAVSLGMGADGLGYLSGAPGVGGFLTATLMLGLGNVRYKGLCTVFGILGYCVALVMLGLAPVFWVALIAAALLGATNSVQAIPRNTAILTMTPDHLRGRVESVRTMLAGGVPPLGYAFTGALAEVVGPSLSLVYGAAACAVIVIIVGLWHRELRDPELGASRT